MGDSVEDAGSRDLGVEWLPVEARVVVLVTATRGEWAAAAVELADLVGRDRRRTIVVNTISGPAGPDRLLHAEGRPGLTAALSGSASIPEVALTPPGCGFSYVPAGDPAVPFARLRELPALGRLADRVRQAGGTLLILVAEEEVGGGPEPRGVDGCVHLGPVDADRTRGSGWPLLARVEAASPAGPEAESAPAGIQEAPSGKEPARVVTAAGRTKPPRPWWRRRSELRAVALVWAAAVVLVWVVWQGLSGWPAFAPGFPEADARQGAAAEGTPPPEGEADAEPAVQGTEPKATAGETPPPARPVAQEAAPPSFGGVELPYSILLVSYVDQADAERLRERLSRQGTFAFIAPTLIRGRLYYRVLAGALSDRERARGWMRQLVAEGAKEREREWDVRPVRFAFTLGEFTDPREAQKLRARLHEAGLPAYVLSDGGEPAVYRTYSGAFESSAAAAGLDTLLRAAGYAPELVPRRGESR